MSATASTLGDSKIWPSYKAVRKAGQRIEPSLDARRLYWTLQGSLSSAIRVMDDKFHDPDSPLEPYCDQMTSPQSLSPISHSTLTEPRILSVTVSIDQLEEWGNQWYDEHREHTDPEYQEAMGNSVRFGPLAGYDSDYDDGSEHLLRCCGEDCPPQATLVVKATGTFLTINDYVTAVHPWLMGHRENILKATGYLEGGDSLPDDAELMVEYDDGPSRLVIYKKTEWLKDRSKKGYLESLERQGLRNEETELRHQVTQ
jgi:hypothetical protein